MNVEEFYARREKLVPKDRANKLLGAFMEKFISEDYDPKNQRRSRLLGCNLSRETKWIPIEDFVRIDLDDEKRVHYYDDRTREMFDTAFGDIREMVAAFEMWEELDAVIFDDGLEWTVVVNHEDIAGLCGVGMRE